MDISVLHSLVADGDPLVDDEAWNDEHALSSDLQTLLTLLESIYNALDGKTIRIPVLIETKTLSSASSVTFSGLDGDTDGEYLLTGYLKWTTTSYPHDIRFYPNADTSSAFDGAAHYYLSNGGGHNYMDLSSYGVLARNVRAGTDPVKLHTEIITPPSDYTYSITNSVNYGNSYTIHEDAHGAHKSTTNVTSIYINTTNGTLTGTLSLYKIVEISL